MKEKVLAILDARIVHHKGWLEHMEDGKHYQSLTWWGAKVNELEEIRELLKEELSK